MTKKCVVFDLDGTLADTASDIALAANMTRTIYGLGELPVEKIKSFIGDGVDKLVERIFQGTSVDPREAASTMRDCYAKSLNMTAKLYPGVYEGVRLLKKSGWKIALFSNKPDEYCKYVLYDFGLGNEFDLIIGASDAFPRKPDPEALECILELSGITSASSSWMVGDSRNDILAGRAAGMKTAFASYGYGKAGDSVPDMEFDDFKQLVEALNEE